VEELADPSRKSGPKVSSCGLPYSCIAKANHIGPGELVAFDPIVTYVRESFVFKIIAQEVEKDEGQEEACNGREWGKADINLRKVDTYAAESESGGVACLYGSV